MLTAPAAAWEIPVPEPVPWAVIVTFGYFALISRIPRIEQRVEQCAAGL